MLEWRAYSWNVGFIFLWWNLTLIHDLIDTRLLCFASPPTWCHSFFRKQMFLSIYALPLNCIKKPFRLWKTLKREELPLLVPPMNYGVTVMVVLLALKTLWCILQQCIIRSTLIVNNYLLHHFHCSTGSRF